jgi:hypothetical protein
MSIIAEKIFETVKSLPDRQAEELPANGDFFACAGIWKYRDITQETLRGLTWRDNVL